MPISGSDSESDIEIQSRLPQKITKKLPPSPKEHLLKEKKKTSVKTMVHSALDELRTRKGVSLYAIKKHLVDKYGADTDKLNFYIKKCIKTGVEEGHIVQVKGVGASGSFRLAPAKKSENKRKKKKIMKPDKPKQEKIEKGKKEKSEKEKNKTEKKVLKKPLTKEKIMKQMVNKEKGQKKPKMKTTKDSKNEKVIKESKKESKTKSKAVEDKHKNTPAKKVIMMKRKSIGSIIKPPKMKPKKRE